MLKLSRLWRWMNAEAAAADAWRICRFEQIEPRCLMAADIHLGVVYDDAASGGDVTPNTFTVTWSGGAPGTELKQLVINTDPTGQGLQLGEVFFNTGPTGLGSFANSPLDIVKHDGFTVSGQNPPNGSQLLTLNFSGFTAGKELVFTIDVDQKTFLGSDAIAEGAEFEASRLTAAFSAPHYADFTGHDIFYDSFDSNLQASGLNLPDDNYVGGLIGGTTVNNTPVPVLTAGAFVAGKQTPLPVTLEGTVYVDGNLDNVQQPGEPGLPGVQLSLCSWNGSTYVPTGATTTTDASGHYKFTGAQPGQYCIAETQPSGYFAVGASAGNVAGVKDGTVKDAHTIQNINVLGGEDVVHNDFSQAQPNSISGHVRTETNGDCQTDPNAKPIAGVSIELLDAKGNQLASTKTDASGSYVFNGLAPGTYQVRKLTPAGYFDDDDHVGSAGGTLIDLNNIGGIVLASAINGINYDFCEALPVSISGTIRTEVEGDCQTDPNAKPISGVTIQLRDAGGNTIATTTTDANGNYLFNKLPPGTYSVHQVLKPGNYDADDHVGTAGGTIVDAETLGSIVLTSGVDGLHYDFCEALPVSISGTVRTEVEGDCQTDPNAKPISGVTIQLRNAGGTVIATTTTDVNGNYLFNGLPPGTYSVHQVLKPGNYDADDHVGTAGGTIVDVETLGSIVLTSGVNGLHYDFCEALPVSISGTVRTEVEGDCQTDPNATPISGVTIQLRNAGGNVIATTTTDANGNYLFNGLPPGSYSVHQVLKPGNYDADDHVGTAGGTIVDAETLGSIALTSGVNGLHYDFCQALPVSISGTVRTEVEGDCQTDPNAKPISGVTIQLRDANGTVIATTLTDANGNYLFNALPPGTYSVHQVLKSGYFDADDHLGTAGGVVVDAETLGAIVLTSGVNGLHYDFCEALPVSVSGTVRTEVEGDCQTDPNAKPISGVTIQLLNQSGSLIATTTTDANGNYLFSALPPGTYSVHEILKPGYFDGDDHVGTAGGTTVDVETLGSIVLTSGVNGQHYDFCQTPPGSISGIVRVDVNGNCDTDPNAPPLAGVMVRLLDNAGNLLASTVTNANGVYTFSGLAPGDYHVQKVSPAGYFDEDAHVGTSGGTIADLNDVTQIALAGGAAATGYDFCEALPVSVAGFVKLEIYGDCETTPTDPPLPGVTIELLDAAGQTIAVTTTDAAGQYVFNGMRPGTYGVRETTPAGYFFSDQHIGTEGGAISGQGVTTSIVLNSGHIGAGYNFCLLPPSSISGYVFVDGPPIPTHDPTADLPGILADLPNLRSGVRVPGDAPVAGVTLRLADATGALLLDRSGNPIETTTDANGFYQFTGLPPGLYTVIKVHPSGYIDGIDRAGSLGGQAISPTLIQAGAQSLGVSISDALISSVGSDNDAIAMIYLDNGQSSVENNFSEITLTKEALPLIIPGPQLTPAELAANGPAFVPLPPAPAAPVASPATSPFTFGTWNISGVTWHLSVIDAGLPRGATAAILRPVRLAGMRADVAAWLNAKMRQGLWTLHSGHAKADAARQVVFGKLGGIPVTGDFDGDGVTDVGVYHEGEWFIDLNGNGVWDEADLWAKLGTKDDKPVTGDWDGDGKTDIGIYGPAWAGDPRAVAKEPGLPDPHNSPTGARKNIPPRAEEATLGVRHMKRTRGGPLHSDVIDHVFHFGTSMDIPVTGDWTGTGVDSIGIFTDGQWVLDVDGDGKRSDADITLRMGDKGDHPVVGDFDGDGVDEIGVYRDGHWHIDINHDGALDERDLHHDLGGAGHRPVVGDWDGDGVDQIGTHREHEPAPSET